MVSGAPNPGILLIVSGPSGVGKTTITHHLEAELDGVFSVSVTTRPKTDKDTQGLDYCFLSMDGFERMREAGELLEWAKVFGHYYGTPRQPVEKSLAEDRLVLLEIDVAGAIQAKRAMPDAFGIFVEPPNKNVLLDRLRRRQRENEKAIQKRFAEANHELEKARGCGAYATFLVNDDLDRAKAEAVRLVRNEQARRREKTVT